MRRYVVYICEQASSSRVGWGVQQGHQVLGDGDVHGQLGDCHLNTRKACRTMDHHIRMVLLMGSSGEAAGGILSRFCMPKPLCERHTVDANDV